MMNISYYMDDGACWQAKAVLAYLQSRMYIFEDGYQKEDIRVKVGRYENCREQGYVFSLTFRGVDGTSKYTLLQRNYAVYQHRNSDAICVLISDVLTLNTPSVNEMWKPKGINAHSTQVDMSFGEDEIIRCGQSILDDMLEYIEAHKLPSEDN